MSNVERGMLYFSESGWAPPDIVEIAKAFEEECDSEEYEEKITALLRNGLRQAKAEGRDSHDLWREAIKVLRKGDHFLLVMVDAAGG